MKGWSERRAMLHTPQLSSILIDERHAECDDDCSNGAWRNVVARNREMGWGEGSWRRTCACPALSRYWTSAPSATCRVSIFKGPSIFDGRELLKARAKRSTNVDYTDVSVRLKQTRHGREAVFPAHLRPSRNERRCDRSLSPAF